MAKNWVQFDESKPKRRTRRFGSRAVQIVPSLPESVRASSWLLDKKAHRRVIKSVLPPGHELAALRDLIRSGHRESDTRAARAYQRMLRAAEEVPQLPDALVEAAGEPRGQSDHRVSYFVWTSLVTDPEGLDVSHLEDYRRVDDSRRIADAMGELWAELYLEDELKGLPVRASRIEAAVVLSCCSPADADEVESLLRSVPRPVERGVPLRSLALLDPVAVFDRELFRRLYSLSREERARRSRAPLRALSRADHGVPEFRPDAIAQLLAGAKSPLDHQVLQDLVGSGGEAWSQPLGLLPRPWLEAAGKVLDQVTRHAEVADQVTQRELRTRERFQWMQEMDLALLPDDGLRRSLEEMHAELRNSVDLAQQLELMAATQGRIYAALTGLPVTVVDAGLDVPLRRTAESLEAALEVARQDSEAVAALGRGQSPAAGPGFRALSQWAVSYPQLVDLAGPIESLPPDLRELARHAIAHRVALGDLGRQARVEADRTIAARESELPRWMGASLAPLRTLARDSVLLRERARDTEVLLDHLLRRIVFDIDRRLPRLDPGLPPFAAFHCSMTELIEAVDLRGTSLRARVSWRRATLKRVVGTLPSADILQPVDTAEPSRRDEGLPVEMVRPLGTSLARARGLQSALLVPYRSGLAYQGRGSDTLPTFARSLGVPLQS